MELLCWSRGEVGVTEGRSIKASLFCRNETDIRTAETEGGGSKKVRAKSDISANESNSDRQGGKIGARGERRQN